MSQNPIEKLVIDVYNKVREESLSDAKSTLAKKVVEFFKGGTMNYRTVERAFKKYIDCDKKVGEPTQATVDFLSKYLGYENFHDFIKENKLKKGKPSRWWPIQIKVLLRITIVIATVLLLMLVIPPWIRQDSGCMVWENDGYVKIACDETQSGSHINIVKYDNRIINNFNKIQVDSLTRFFNINTKEPLVWYYKDKNGKIEYFTADGNHPITGEALQPVTQEFIDQYIKPTKTAILNESVKNTSGKKDIAVLIFNETALDYSVAKQLQKGPFEEDRVTPYLIVSGAMNKRLRNDLLQGNIHSLGKNLYTHVDELCIGTISYRFREAGNDSKEFVCDISLEYDIFSANGSRVDGASQIKNVRGMGFSKSQAKQTALQNLVDSFE